MKLLDWILSLTATPPHVITLRPVRFSPASSDLWLLCHFIQSCGAKHLLVFISSPVAFVFIFTAWIDIKACGGAEVHAGIVLPFGIGSWERGRTSEVGFDMKKRQRERNMCQLMSDGTTLLACLSLSLSVLLSLFYCLSSITANLQHMQYLKWNVARLHVCFGWTGCAGFLRLEKLHTIITHHTQHMVYCACSVCRRSSPTDLSVSTFL